MADFNPRSLQHRLSFDSIAYFALRFYEIKAFDTSFHSILNLRDTK